MNMLLSVPVCGDIGELKLCGRYNKGFMAIDDSGEWWTGTSRYDIEHYLAASTQAEEVYAATVFHAVICSCSSNLFLLARAGDLTRRTCVHCGQVRYICRDGDLTHWEEAVRENELHSYRCIGCEGNVANISLGFAGYVENPELDAVKWFYVGVRCCECGILGCFNDGKIGRGPMNASLFSQVAGEPSTNDIQNIE
jgi:ferredoxin-like protein FixX